MENINHRSFKQDWQSRRRDLVSLMLYLLVYGAALITFVGIAFTVGYILVKGLPNLNMSLFAWTYNSENVSLLPALINTIFMTILALSVAVPIGIGASIYLVEYVRVVITLLLVLFGLQLKRSLGFPPLSMDCLALFSLLSSLTWDFPCCQELLHLVS